MPSVTRTGSAKFTPRFAANYLATMAFVFAGWRVATGGSPLHRRALDGTWDLTPFGLRTELGMPGIMRALVCLYAVLLVLYYLRHPRLRSRAYVFLQGLWFATLRAWRGSSRAHAAARRARTWRLPLSFSLSPAARQAGLTLLLRFYFVPLMLNWSLAGAGEMSNALLQFFFGLRDGVSGRLLFDTSLFWALFQLLLFVDTLVFTLGYLIESPGLENRIRSVDPTFFGWAICLACYPPFNDVTSRFLPWQSQDFPHFESTAAHLTANIAILLSMAIYSWSALALGWKASNLTNRGIVSVGPYSVVRHPAYAAKNLAWWIGASPNLVSLIGNGSYDAAAYAAASLLGWTLIYALRALTEERHLLMIDNGYAEYSRRVRFRFIPRVL